MMEIYFTVIVLLWAIPYKLRMRNTTDPTHTEWNLISYCFPKPAAIGRPRKHSYRELFNAIFCLLRTGCQWRNQRFPLCQPGKCR